MNAIIRAVGFVPGNQDSMPLLAVFNPDADASASVDDWASRRARRDRSPVAKRTLLDPSEVEMICLPSLSVQEE